MNLSVFPQYIPVDRQPDLSEVMSLSGGRSSAFALMSLINGGFGASKNHYVLFENMGLEDETCYKFLDDIERATGLDIKWLEYTLTEQFFLNFINPKFSYLDFYNCQYLSIDQILDIDKLKKFDYKKSPKNDWYKLGYSHKVNSIKMVTYESASRIGEPFIDLFLYKCAIRIMKGLGILLPTASHRWCTGDGKEKIEHRWLSNVGIKEFISYKGMRYDEPDRVRKVKEKNNNQDKIWYDCPLHNLKISKADVFASWSFAGIDLGLSNGVNSFLDVKGNCKFCHLKKLVKKMFLMQQGDMAYLPFMQMEKLANNYNGDIDAMCRQHGTFDHILERAMSSKSIKIEDVLSDGEQEISCFGCGD